MEVDAEAEVVVPKGSSEEVLVIEFDPINEVRESLRRLDRDVLRLVAVSSLPVSLVAAADEVEELIDRLLVGEVS